MLILVPVFILLSLFSTSRSVSVGVIATWWRHLSNSLQTQPLAISGVRDYTFWVLPTVAYYSLNFSLHEHCWLFHTWHVAEQQNILDSRQSRMSKRGLQPRATNAVRVKGSADRRVEKACGRNQRANRPINQPTNVQQRVLQHRNSREEE